MTKQEEQSQEIPVTELVSGDVVQVNEQECMVLGGQQPVTVVPGGSVSGIELWSDPETGAPFVEIHRPGSPPFRAPVTVSEVSDE